MRASNPMSISVRDCFTIFLNLKCATDNSKTISLYLTVESE